MKKKNEAIIGKKTLVFSPAIDSTKSLRASTAASAKFWIPDGTMLIFRVAAKANISKIIVTIQVVKIVFVTGIGPIENIFSAASVTSTLVYFGRFELLKKGPGANLLSPYWKY